MEVKITNTIPIFCWMCGAKVHIEHTERVINHSKTCLKCAEIIFEILNEYQ